MFNSNSPHKNGIEIYGTIIKIKERKIPSMKVGILPQEITVKYCVSGCEFEYTQLIYNISFLDFKKLEIGKQIRIKYLFGNPENAYISEFDYSDYRI